MTETIERLRAALADRYHLELELGTGGMATVYLAEDCKHGRQVAVKVLRPELALALGADRFLREVAIAARLNHPNILALHDSGEADGFLCYVMPFLDGPTLRQRLSRERELPIPDAVRIVRAVADETSMKVCWVTGINPGPSWSSRRRGTSIWSSPLCFDAISTEWLRTCVRLQDDPPPARDPLAHGRG